jgi:hypothetical protein
MMSSDKARIVTGIGALGAAVGISVIAIRSEPDPRPPAGDPSPSVVLSAAESGMDLSGGGPLAIEDRLRGEFDAGSTTPMDTIEFRNGVYVDAATGAAVTAYASSSFAGGSPELICCLVDGRLQGPSVRFYEAGAMHRQLHHVDGEIASQIIEYFPNGELKLRAVSWGSSENGGTALREITVGSSEDGGYRRRDLGTGRVQFINAAESTTFRNGETPIDDVAGWMLFHDGVLGQKAWTNDSRSITQP